MQSKIAHVTVYRNSAKINRAATVELKSGTQEVVLSGLSPHINPQSMQVGVAGGATLLSAQFRQKKKTLKR